MLLFRNSRKTGSAASAPRKELVSSYAVSRRASAPFALLKKLIAMPGLLFCAGLAFADPLFYVVTQNQQSGTQLFGTVDPLTGSFTQIGPTVPIGEVGLVSGPGGSLLTVDYSGNLDSVNLGNGALSVIGATGLGVNIAAFGELGGNLYATDLANNFYSVNPSTGAAQQIGATHSPVIPFVPGTANPDGTINIYNETLFSVGGKLYATLDADIFDTGVPVINPVVNPKLYQIDLSTGAATPVASTELLITSALEVNGTVYGFAGNAEALSHSFTLDVANGNTTFITNVDPAAGLIFGAVSTPEPSSMGLAGFGIALFAVSKLRRAKRRD
jgi:hypothetical protein